MFFAQATQVISMDKIHALEELARDDVMEERRLKQTLWIMVAMQFALYPVTQSILQQDVVCMENLQSLAEEFVMRLYSIFQGRFMVHFASKAVVDKGHASGNSGVHGSLGCYAILSDDGWSSLLEDCQGKPCFTVLYSAFYVSTDCFLYTGPFSGCPPPNPSPFLAACTPEVCTCCSICFGGEKGGETHKCADNCPPCLPCARHYSIDAIVRCFADGKQLQAMEEEMGRRFKGMPKKDVYAWKAVEALWGGGQQKPFFCYVYDELDTLKRLVLKEKPREAKMREENEEKREEEEVGEEEGEVGAEEEKELLFDGMDYSMLSSIQDMDPFY